MSNLAKMIAIFRTFNYKSAKEILVDNKDVSYKEATRHLTSNLAKDDANPTIVELLAATFRTSKGLLINGEITPADLEGVIDEKEGGIVVFLPGLIAESLTHWLANNRPQYKVGEDWDGNWEEAGWSYYWDSLENNLKDVPDNRMPTEKVMIGDICIGLYVSDGEYKNKIVGLIHEAFADLAKQTPECHQQHLKNLGLTSK